jgi:hypothetical protein
MSRPYVITFPSSVREGHGRVGVVITNIIRIVPHEKNPETSILFMVDRSATLVDMTIDQVRDSINTFLGLAS